MTVDRVGGADFCVCGHRGWDHVRDPVEGILCATFAFPPAEQCECRDYRAVPRSGLKADDPMAYMMARLERDRRLCEASDGLGRNEVGLARFAYFRQQTEATRRVFEEAEASGGGFLSRRRLGRAAEAFVGAAMSEIREYEELIVDMGSDPDDELAMDRLLTVFEADDDQALTDALLADEDTDSPKA